MQRVRWHGLHWGVVATTVVCLVAGYMLAVSAATAGGTDLRPERNADLSDLARDRASKVERLQADVTSLRSEVNKLSGDSRPGVADQGLTTAATDAMMRPVKGPAVTVTLSDAPVDIKPIGVDEDLLVVHQQDIQQVANVLWEAGAEAMTIQGQRIIATTGIKCVGNTVVLHGIPYAPPYVITVIGDQNRLEQALRDDAYLQVYRQYATQYQLGYKQERVTEVTMPAYQGPLDVTQATPR